MSRLVQWGKKSKKYKKIEFEGVKKAKKILKMEWRDLKPQKK